MAYIRKIWKDHVVQYPKTYTVTENPDGTKTLVEAPGEIIQQGTPMSATNFNNAEEALVYYSAAFEMQYAITQALIRDLESRLAIAEAELATIP
jgi:hypothetical protein